ncbi:MAG: hypothetical protein AAF561_13035 [Planctomycetota bacterium]
MTSRLRAGRLLTIAAFAALLCSTASVRAGSVAWELPRDVPPRVAQTPAPKRVSMTTPFEAPARLVRVSDVPEWQVSSPSAMPAVVEPNADVRRPSRGLPATLLGGFGTLLLIGWRARR